MCTWVPGCDFECARWGACELRAKAAAALTQGSDELASIQVLGRTERRYERGSPGNHQLKWHAEWATLEREESARRPASYEDLAGLADGVRAEIIAGVLELSPAPLPRHSRAQGSLRNFIGGPYDDDDGRGGPGGWWILLEVDVRLTGQDIVRPDLAGWRRDRLCDPWDRRPIDAIPDWICEVVSPSNAARDRVVKRRLHARHAVPFYWLADPHQRTLEALKLVGDHWLELGSWGDGDLARIEPFADVELEVGRLFPPLSPTSTDILFVAARKTIPAMSRWRQNWACPVR